MIKKYVVYNYNIDGTITKWKVYDTMEEALEHAQPGDSVIEYYMDYA